MQKVVLITFDLRDFHLGSPFERIIVNQHDKVRFELTNVANLRPETLAGTDFVVVFRDSPFGRIGQSGGFQEFSTDLPESRDEVKKIGEATAEKPGEYKFSYGLTNKGRWEVEVDPYLIVLPSDFPPFPL